MKTKIEGFEHNLHDGWKEKKNFELDIKTYKVNLGGEKLNFKGGGSCMGQVDRGRIGPRCWIS